jgi:hypothetical protein
LLFGFYFRDAVDLADRFVDNLLKTPPPRAVVVAHQTSTPMTTTMPVNSSIRATITISDPMDRDVMGLVKKILIFPLLIKSHIRSFSWMYVM